MDEEKKEIELKKINSGDMNTISAGMFIGAFVMCLGVIITLVIAGGMAYMGGDRVFPKCPTIECPACPACPAAPQCQKCAAVTVVEEACIKLKNALSELYGGEAISVTNFLLEHCGYTSYQIRRAQNHD